MNKKGPIIVIEDDPRDRELLAVVFRELEYLNEVVFFEDGAAALVYLQDDAIYPFIILSDVDLPKLSGVELRKMIHTNEGLSSKCIPYLFFSTTVDKKAVSDAYTSPVQGFFLKPPTYRKLTATIKLIVDYWMECYSPHSYE
jgi:CheY-like chemotaxis protein